MSVDVFKQELWSRTIQNELDVLTGLRTHSNYAFQGEIKGGNKLHVTGSVKPTIGTYVPGTDITVENYDGTDQVIEINQYRYFSRYYDDVDIKQSIPGVMENDSKECAKELHLEGDKYVATLIKDEVVAGKIKTSDTAITPSKTNTVEAVEDGLVYLYEQNVNPKEDLWGEFSPKFYSKFRQALTETLTDNVQLAKDGAVGMYNKVKVCIENLLPTNNTVRYNIIRTGKAVAFAGQIDKVTATPKEKGFGDIVKGLYVFGGKVLRPKEAYAIQETIPAPVEQVGE